ncbi:arylamine N-acetyltransferase 1 [Aspergillus lentulus]|uniref:Arylamine N-acetyltransferase 1 n=1 Tax=Aspergillus lentulus TaxID=293939 RepID=A0AAN4PEE1_ASPLE|nr:arylamine N-acetyltransferase 1 [Aspergillus lentulus]
MAYTQAELTGYFDRINLPTDAREALLAGKDRLEALTCLLHHHLAAVPFENIALHYTADRVLVLSPSLLYEKIVRRRQGGTCFQITRLFGEVLLALGFELYMSGARTNKSTSVAAQDKDGLAKFGDWQHMILIVRLDGNDYLVDAGFGPNGPVDPVLLRDGLEFTDGNGNLGRRGRVVHAPIDQGRARHLKYWRLQFRFDGSPDWTDIYAFTESEWLENDYQAAERAVRGNKRAWFMYRVIAFQIVLKDRTPVGWVMIWNDAMSWSQGGKLSRRMRFGSEEERINALESVFGIKLGEEERKEIVGTVAFLGGKSKI